MSRFEAAKPDLRLCLFIKEVYDKCVKLLDLAEEGGNVTLSNLPPGQHRLHGWLKSSVTGHVSRQPVTSVFNVEFRRWKAQRQEGRMRRHVSMHDDAGSPAAGEKTRIVVLTAAPNLQGGYVEMAAYNFIEMGLLKDMLRGGTFYPLQISISISWAWTWRLEL